MAGSNFGNLFCISTWGESHGKGIGVVIDGCPAGLSLCEADIQQYLDRRKPGQSAFSTQRKEGDLTEILSGVFDGKTTGTPISLMVRNQDQRSQDYGAIATCYRPGHGDYTYNCKYGFRDYRGGGRSSGRETIGRVAAGAIAAKLLSNLGIEVYAYTKSIGPIGIDPGNFNREEISKNRLYMPDLDAVNKAELYLEEQMEKGDSTGGVIECIVKHLPIGIGEPVFEKLSANLAKAILSIGAVKGFEIGDGFDAAKSSGTDNNDAFIADKEKKISKKTNHAGGILGGMSDGSDIIIRAAFKPTPSISSSQETVTNSGDNIQIRIKGRHDPIIVPRAVVVVESMTALTLVDMLFMNMTSRLDKIIDFYSLKI